MKCFEEEKPIKWSFCINKVNSSKSTDLIYYFHGRNGAANWWNDKTYYTGKIHELWLKKGIEPPIVASISFGKLWLLVEREDEEHGGLYRVFLDYVMKRVEQEINNPIHHRSAMGESMGGVNTLMMAMKTKNVFNKAASLCAALPTVSPYASLKEIYDYVNRSSTSLKRALMMFWFSKKFYPTEEIWENNDPLQLSKKNTSAGSPSIYISCGEKDEWGCMEGSKLFVKNIGRTGGEIHWFSRPGGHCDIDTESLSNFLVE
ncbi:MAG: alpha/beta hydrolase-fold protein [Bacteriovoracaceae bacterium]